MVLVDPRGHVGTRMSTEAREFKIQGPPQKSSLKVTQAGPRKGNSTVWDSISGRWIDVPVHPWPLRCDGSALRSGPLSRRGSAYLTMGHNLSIALVASASRSSSRAALYRGSHRRSILLLCNNGSGPEIGLPGQILPGLFPGMPWNRPFGRSSACRRSHFGIFPVSVRPTSGQGSRFPVRNHYCVTQGSSRWTKGSASAPP